MDFKCKCGSKSFFIQSKGSQIGLYCSVCGKWQKWLTKDEVRQFEYETNTLDSKENNPDDDFYEKFALTPWGCLHWLLEILDWIFLKYLVRWLMPLWKISSRLWKELILLRRRSKDD